MNSVTLLPTYLVKLIASHIPPCKHQTVELKFVTCTSIQTELIILESNLKG